MMSTEQLCEGLIRHLEIQGEEVFEKNFIKDDKITCSVFAIVGDNAEEMTGLFREWMASKGFKRHS